MALKLKGSTSGFVGLDAPSVAGNNTLILPENSGSAFQVFANDITAGVTTFTQVTISRNGDLTVPGTISIGGTLTYEDVTSVDSIGIVTARGLSIFGNTSGLNVASGISTFQAVTGTTGTFSGDITANGNIVGDNSTNISGISSVTATTFYGDGSNLSNIVSTTINSNADNRIITGSGTANTLNGEANLTYNGSVLQVAADANTEGIEIISSGDTYNDIVLNANRSGSNSHIGRLVGEWNGGRVAALIFNTGGDTSSKDDGEILFATSNGASSPTTRMKIGQDGTVTYYNSIFGGDNKPIYLGNANDLSLFHDSGGASVIRYNHNVGGLHFRNNSNADQMIIDSNGHLLHGVASDEDTSGSGGLRFINTGDIQIDGDQKALVFRSTNNTAQTQSAIEWWNENGAGIQAKILVDRTAVSQAPSDLVFYTNSNVDSGADGTEKLRIASDGVVSIGTNDNEPAQLKVVYSTVPTYLTSTFDGTVGEATLSVNVPRTSDGSGSWGSHSNTGYGSAAIQALSHSSSGGYVSILTGSADNTNPTEKLRISSEGYVTKPNHPCFRVGRNGNVTMSAGGTIVFNYVTSPTHFNQGTHYNTSTGAFTAPVAGVYSFHAHVLYQSLGQGQNMNDAIYFYYNSSGGASGGVQMSYDHRRAEYIGNETGSGGYFSTHTTVMVDMAANGSVYVVNNRANLEVHGNANYTFFQGFLIG